MKIYKLLFIFGFICICIFTIIVIYQKLRKNCGSQKNSYEYIPIIYDKFKNLNFSIYFINLDKSIDRLQNIYDEIKLFNIKNIHRISAINGKEINFSTDNIQLNNHTNILYKNFDKKLTKGELGCTLSHIKAIYNSYNNCDNIAMIIEDDMTFTYSNYAEDIADIISNCPNDWNIISLFNFTCSKNPKKYIKHTKGNYCLSTGAYIINRKGMYNFLNNVIQNGIITIKSSNKNNAADYFLFDNTSNVYYYNGFPPIIPNNINSTIRNNISWQDKHVKQIMDKYLPQTKIHKGVKLPNYYLENTDNNQVNNLEDEDEEQKLLVEVLKKGDNVLQLGGNIGRSCITANKAEKLSNNVCVEPNNKVFSILEKNVKTHKVPATLINGVITKNCKDLLLNESGIDGGASSLYTSNSDNIPKQKVQCKSLDQIKPTGGFNVLFADCEGCLPDFLKEFGDELKESHNLHSIIYEKDVHENVSYDIVDEYIKNNNFTCVGDFHRKCTKK